MGSVLIANSGETKETVIVDEIELAPLMHGWNILIVQLNWLFPEMVICKRTMRSCVNCG